MVHVKVETVPAYNITKKFHPKANQWVGYILTLSDGQRIYDAGDADFIPEMKHIKTDIALMPCGGTYTMNATEMAEAAVSDEVSDGRPAEARSVSPYS